MIIEVDPGTYTDACQLKDSGTVALPITLRGLAGPRPIFDATGHRFQSVPVTQAMLKEALK